MFSIFKKRRPIVIDKDEFQPIFDKLIISLKKSSNKGQVACVEKVKSALLTNDEADFIKKLTGVSMWGGSGAVWEVGGFPNDADEREFIIEITKLTDLMKKSGIRSYAAQSRGRALKRIYRL